MLAIFRVFHSITEPFPFSELGGVSYCLMAVTLQPSKLPLETRLSNDNAKREIAQPVVITKLRMGCPFISRNNPEVTDAFAHLTTTQKNEFSNTTENISHKKTVNWL